MTETSNPSPDGLPCGPAPGAPPLQRARPDSVAERREPPSGSDLRASGIRVRGLTRRFGSRVALHPIELDVEPGTVTGLLGPNGSGKSTLLRCLVGLVRADAGRALVDGVALAGDGVAVRRRVSYSPGEIALYGEMRGRAHLEWLLRGRGKRAVERAVSVAREIELPLRQRVRTYSHGMKRQLLFAAAIAPRLPVRILDEPTEGLDPSKRGLVLDMLRADVDGGSAILLSSHHLGEVDRVCDRLVFLDRGHKLADESAADVARRASRVVQMELEREGDPRALAAALDGLAGAAVASEGTRVTARLADDDPRPFLAAAFARTDLPRPLAVRFGELSLAELYRELYGVEAC